MIVAQLIFWICILAIAHSYVAYPLLLSFFVKIKGKKEYQTYSIDEDLPIVSILLAAYNEDQIIEKKIRSVFTTSYPSSKIELLIGSDNSNDLTNSILNKLSLEYPQIQTIFFNERQGKVKIINQLSDKARGEILIITDANVLFENNTIDQLITFFKDEKIGLVDSHMTNYGIKKSGISFQEKSYISREVYVKQLESKAFGTMIGPFGGCYALRKNLFIKVPPNFLVDDFFICMNVLAQHKDAINNINAIVNEDVSNNLSVEFKRKIRIAIGNFQNLITFRKFLWPPFNAINFCFISHKVLRWFGPFFLIGAFSTNLFLINESYIYKIALLFQVIITFLPIADFFLKKFGFHIVLLRFATHFYTMNLSLMIGFVKSLKGVKSNVWKPTERFQK